MLFGFILTDILDSNNIIVLSCMWIGILLLGCTVLVKFGWKQNKNLCIYWITTLTIGILLSGIQLYLLNNSYRLLPINHISTVWLVIIAVNFIVTTVFSKITFFLLSGIIMLATAFPLDSLKLSYPATMYGILLTIVLIGYIILTYVAPNDPLILGEKYNQFNNEDENLLTNIHKFKCMSCGLTYEGYEKLDYCPRCMAGTDLLIDVN